MTDSPSVRSRVPWLRLAILLLAMGVMLSHVVTTLLIPTRHATHEARLRAEQEQLIAARRARIAKLLSEGDGCHPSIAHELAKALVFDGQSARDYAADYQRRCGEDPVIAHWGAAPVAKLASAAASASSTAVHPGTAPGRAR